MKMIRVDNVARARQFLEFPVKIYKNDPNWIRPLDKDIQEVFDKDKNRLFKRSGNECERWLLLDDGQEIIGRVATFVNKKYVSPGDTQPTGGIGFFDCIDDQEAANYIFDFARDWLRDRGMEAMDGPINFGERDRWWGLLVEGFDEPPYGMNYNPPYYQKLFENYGFKVFFYQNCYGLLVNDRLEEKHYIRHDQLSKNSHFHAEHLKKKALDKYAEDFSTVYNKAWASHGGNKTMDVRKARKIFQSMKPVIDEKAVWYAYYDNEPISCWLNLPDLNQWFKYLHGKFGLFQKLKFLWIKNTRKNRRLIGLVFGVVPEFQGKGADSFMIVEGAKLIQREKLYETFEMMWIGDFNPKMINVAKSLGSHLSRKLATYRYLFDREKEFKRHPTV